MARRRIVDGTSIYNEPWDSQTRDVLLYLLSVCADNFGLFPDRVSNYAQALGLDEHSVRDRVDVLEEAGVIVRYEDGGATYYAFRKWQDYQQLRITGRPACPLPDTETLQKLSVKTQALLQKACAETRRAVAVAVAVADGSANALPPPDSPAGTAAQWALRYFFQRLRGHTGLERPVMPFARAAGFLTKREKEAGETAEDFRDLIDWFFAVRIRGDHSSGNWSLFESAYNAGCIYVQKRRQSSANGSA